MFILLIFKVESIFNSNKQQLGTNVMINDRFIFTYWTGADNFPSLIDKLLRYSSSVSNFEIQRHCQNVYFRKQFYYK